MEDRLRSYYTGITKTVTFCVTYFAHQELLDVCLDSINRYYPGVGIIISHENIDRPTNTGKAKLISHDMGVMQWSGVAQRLLEECETDYAVFMEHDTFLTNPLDELLGKMTIYDLIGPQEIIPYKKLNRHAPNMVCQNFFIINVKKMKEFGLDKVRIRDIDLLQAKGFKNLESGYGISQTLRTKLFLPVRKSPYGYGTYYGDVCHHMWYGSYKSRNTGEDDIDRRWLDKEVRRMIRDYKNDCIKYINNAK